MEETARTYTYNDLRTKIATDPTWCERAIVAIYKRQTEDEQRVQATKVQNGVGFNGTDAFILSSFAKQVMAGHRLSKKQLGIGYRKIVKYAGQLSKIAGIKVEKIKGSKKNNLQGELL